LKLKHRGKYFRPKEIPRSRFVDILFSFSLSSASAYCVLPTFQEQTVQNFKEMRYPGKIT